MNSSNPWDAALFGPVNIPVTAFGLPPAARQPGTDLTIDTSDTRFINASTQRGDSLWQGTHNKAWKFPGT